MSTVPHRDEDRVLTLYAHYFVAAELMRDNYIKLRAKRKRNGDLSQSDTVDERIYFSTWLGFLGVTCEGFKKVRMRLLLQDQRPDEFRELISKSNAIGRAIKQHSDPLREVRNNVFHLRDDVEAFRRFFADETGRLAWAEELHKAFVDLFSEYRILCEIHYIVEGRKSEMQHQPKISKRRRVSTL